LRIETVRDAGLSEADAVAKASTLTASERAHRGTPAFALSLLSPSDPADSWCANDPDIEHHSVTLERATVRPLLALANHREIPNIIARRTQTYAIRLVVEGGGQVKTELGLG
jgi:hypothetical protein